MIKNFYIRKDSWRWMKQPFLGVPHGNDFSIIPTLMGNGK
jgi:hypothetical protein